MEIALFLSPFAAEPYLGWEIVCRGLMAEGMVEWIWMVDMDVDVDMIGEAWEGKGRYTNQA